MIPHSEWQWVGYPGHFCAADRCMFRLCTVIGDVMVSTVGEYYPDENREMQQIGCDRKYETMTWRAEPCVNQNCDCGMWVAGVQLDGYGAYNDRKSAADGHYALCMKAARGEIGATP